MEVKDKVVVYEDKRDGTISLCLITLKDMWSGGESKIRTIKIATLENSERRKTELERIADYLNLVSIDLNVKYEEY